VAATGEHPQLAPAVAAVGLRLVLAATVAAAEHPRPAVTMAVVTRPRLVVAAAGRPLLTSPGMPRLAAPVVVAAGLRVVVVTRPRVVPVVAGDHRAVLAAAVVAAARPRQTVVAGDLRPGPAPPLPHQALSH
jgi:hypothetical protein